MSEDQLIIEADDDAVNWEIIAWADIQDIWESNERILNNINLVIDVIPSCVNAEIDSEEWDGDFPGRSGVFYKIYSCNPEALKEEIKYHILEIISQKTFSKTAKIYQQPNIKTAHQIVDLLMAEAAYFRNIRGPAGYSGMGIATAEQLEKGAIVFNQGAWDKDSIIAELKKLKNEIKHSPGSQNLIQRIITDFEKS